MTTHHHLRSRQPARIRRPPPRAPCSACCSDCATARSTLQLPDGSSAHFGNESDDGPRAAMRLRNWNVCGAALQLGRHRLRRELHRRRLDHARPDRAADAVHRQPRRDRVDRLRHAGGARCCTALKHLLNRNSRRGSRKNIHAHYDLGNEFYRLWLDETMNYSSAWFEGDRSRPMPEAQHAKVRRALREAGVQPGDRVLEIGCGWGALAECAAREFGARVTGVTLSSEQLAWAQKRLARRRPRRRRPALAGLPRHRRRPVRRHRLDRDVRGRRPRVLAELLRDAARPAQARRPACIQSITIRDDLFERYVKSTDFIQQYIFPGGLLPSPSAFREAAAQAGLRGGQRARLRPRLRRDAAPLARALPGRRSARCGGSASTRASCASGSSTSPTARRPSPPATPTSCSSRCSATERAMDTHRRAPAAAAWQLAPLAARRQRRRAAPRWRPSCRARGCRAAAGCASSACTSTTRGCGSTSGFSADRFDRHAAGARAGVRARAVRPADRRALARGDAAQSAASATRRRERWLAAMKRAFPDVDEGDRITGVQRPGEGVRFFHNGTLRGEVRDADFARRFFGIWLSPQTSEPELRQSLLGRRAAAAMSAAACPVAPARRQRPRRLARRPVATARSACRWPSSRCRCTWCCPTTTPAPSACRWRCWARCCWARGCSTRWSTR